MKRGGRVGLNIGLAVTFLGLGVGVLLLLWHFQPAVETRQRPAFEPVIRATAIALSKEPLRLSGFGTAGPRLRRSYHAEVAGRIAEDSPRLRSGQLVSQGDLLMHIDSPATEQMAPQRAAHVDELQAELALLEQRHASDERFVALERRSAELARSAFDSERDLLAEGRSSQRRVDELERAWNQAQSAVVARERALAAYPSERAGLEARIRAAEAALSEAEEMLARTRVMAPWRAVVLDAHAEPGEPVNVGTPLFSIAAVDSAEASVGTLTGRLLTLIGPRADPLAAAPEVIRGAFVLDVDPHSFRYPGTLERIEGRLLSGTREAVAVLQLDAVAEDAPRPPLLDNTVGRIELLGRDLAGFRLPREALLDDESIWVVDRQGELQRRRPRILHRERDRVVIAAADPELTEGDLVVLTSLDEAFEGMRVRVERVDVPRTGDPVPAADERPGDGGA